MESSAAEVVATFVLYDKKTGDVVHVHTEHALGPQASAPTEASVCAELARLLPEGRDLAALRTEEPVAPVRGTRLFVDVQAKTLMRVRSDAAKPAKKKAPAPRGTGRQKPAKAPRKGKRS